MQIFFFFKILFSISDNPSVILKRLHTTTRSECPNGDPLNTHCLCAAGRGHHGTCKHVAAVCIMLSHLTESGTMNIAKSSTVNLMSFIKPKAYYSGKLKAQVGFSDHLSSVVCLSVCLSVLPYVRPSVCL